MSDNLEKLTSSRLQPQELCSHLVAVFVFDSVPAPLFAPKKKEKSFEGCKAKMLRRINRTKASWCFPQPFLPAWFLHQFLLTVHFLNLFLVLIAPTPQSEYAVFSVKEIAS